MTPRARMLATDLDGTLLAPDGSVSPRTVAALTAARDSDLTVTLVTGRPPRWLAPIVAQTGWHGLAVAANGAVLVDLNRQLVERTFPIESEILLDTIARVRLLLPGAAFAVEHVAQGSGISDAPADVPYQLLRRVGKSAEFGHEPGYSPRLAVPSHTPTGPAEELIRTGNVVKLLARGPVEGGHDPDQTLERIQRELEGVVTVTHSTHREVLLEMSRHGTSKATGVAWLAKSHGIDQADVIAVGDMPNDLPMLMWAGEGWAPSNAHTAVLEAVTVERTLPSNADDGVAQLIEKLLGHPS